MTDSQFIFVVCVASLFIGSALTALVGEVARYFSAPRVYRHSGSRAGVNYREID